MSLCACILTVIHSVKIFTGDAHRTCSCRLNSDPFFCPSDPRGGPRRGCP